MVPGLPSAGPPPIFPETENLNRENFNLHAFSKNPKFKPAQPPFAGLNFGPISRGLNLIPPGIKKKGMGGRGEADSCTVYFYKKTIRAQTKSADFALGKINDSNLRG